MAKVDTSDAGQICLSVIVEQVSQREWHVLEIGSELTFHRGEHLRLRPLSANFRREIAQAGEAPFADNAFGLLCDDTQHTDHLAPVVGQGRVGKGMVSFLGIAAALEKEQKALIPRRVAAPQHALDPWTDVGPNLLPDLARGYAQGPRVLDAERRTVGVIVEEQQFFSPPHPHLVARGQQNSYDGLEALWPRLGRTERCIGPVLRTHQRAHLAAARKEVRRGRNGGLGRRAVPSVDRLAPQIVDGT